MTVAFSIRSIRHELSGDGQNPNPRLPEREGVFREGSATTRTINQCCILTLIDGDIRLL
jgi:hypothetical protein